ncbi:hypothetical protein B7463_g5984, partial [Scytalidium lignicola]
MASLDIEAETKRRLVVTGRHEPLKRIHPAVDLPTDRVNLYFWGLDTEKGHSPAFRQETGYQAARKLIADGDADRLKELSNRGLEILASVFKDLDVDPPKGNSERAVHDVGRVLPSKGYGLTRASEEVIQLLHVEDFPPPLLINGALFGSGFANMLIGAYDPETLYSNYCTDMGFFYEHSYHKVFPEYESLLKVAADDANALQTPGGIERRVATDIGLGYIKGKVSLEEGSKKKLANKTAKLNRREALVLFFCESSIWGMAAEAIARGFDKAGVVNDFAFSSPGTDVVDVGSDLCNSELINAFLCTSDVTESGVVTEEILRRVYDAYAHCGAKMFTERWSEPGARMCATLYTWHIQNNRHEFFRRAVLGYSKARKCSKEQREADFDEAFDSTMHTTMFSRPLIGACNSGDPCDQVELRLQHSSGAGLLTQLWWLLSTGPVQYASSGVVCKDQEDELAEALRLAMAKAYSQGLVDEMTWLMAHANHHAWQVNYLFEAAMFGSLLDNGNLKGKLDRKEA